MSEEQDGVHRATGKWTRADVPHRGWECIEVTYNPSGQICQMCEVQEIHYVHHMRHEKVLEVLECGCVCAGAMEGDCVGARWREGRFKSRAKRRRKFPDLDGWRVSVNGNEFIRKESFHVVIFAKRNKWSGCVTDKVTDVQRFASRLYDTSDAVKLAAFDVMEAMKGDR